MNEKRFEEVLAAIEQSERENNETLLDMGSWAARDECGTTMCLAGWAATLAGDPPDFVCDDDGWARYTEHTASGEQIWVVAERWLHATERETNVLFHWSDATTAEALRRDVAEYVTDGLVSLT